MKICKFLTFLAVLFLTGCGTLEVGIEHKPTGTETEISLPTNEATLTVPILQPSPTIESLPPTPTTSLPTATQVEPISTPGQQMVKIYLIALEDNGQSGQLVGCGDSVIPVDVEIPPTKEVLRVSMEKLLTMKEQYYGLSGVYNALFQSDLKVESISLENGKAHIYLTGSMMLGGECDNPRFEAQIESTILQFSTIQEVAIFINGKPLKEAISLK